MRACPRARCKGTILLEDERAVCSSCGRQDHTQSLPAQVSKFSTKWLTVMVPYVGTEWRLRQRRLRVNIGLKNLKHPLCPFKCGQGMDRMWKTSYKCSEDHIIHLEVQPDNSLGWR